MLICVQRKQTVLRLRDKDELQEAQRNTGITVSEAKMSGFNSFNLNMAMAVFIDLKYSAENVLHEFQRNCRVNIIVMRNGTTMSNGVY